METVTQQSPLRIMLVEDNPDHAELVLRCFEDEDVIPSQISYLTDGQEALNYLFQNKIHPQLIILDLKLPKITGFEVLVKIKESNDLKHIPVVILTTSDEQKDKEKAYSLGVKDYLVKPLDSDVFSNLVRGIATCVESDEKNSG